MIGSLHTETLSVWFVTGRIHMCDVMCVKTVFGAKIWYSVTNEWLAEY